MGAFRADPWVAGAALLMIALLLAFVAYPVGSSLSAALKDDTGVWSLGAWWGRLSNDRVWGLGCLQGAVHCGVAWNTLWMATAVGLGTTLLGLLLALLSERTGLISGSLSQGALQLLTLLPIITPPFVVGLGLILLFGRAGLVNQGLEWLWGIPPTRWFYGGFGLWMAQMFAFTPIAYLMLRGVVQGIAPSLEEASQTLGASRWQVLRTVTLPLLKPGLANAFLIGFIESMADFGNPVVVGGSYSVLATDIFFAIVGAQFDPGRAAGLAWLLTGFAVAAFILQQHLVGAQRYTTVSGKGDSGFAMPLPRGLHRLLWSVALPWLSLTALVYVFAFAGGFVNLWGRDYTLTFKHFITAFDLEWDSSGLVWLGTAWPSLWTTLKLSVISAPLSAALGLLMAWVLSRHQFRGRRLLEFSTLMAFAIPGTVLGVSYVVAFNVPPIELTGTGAVIVLCFLFRNLPVGVRAGTSALGQIDRSLEEASAMLHASTPQTLRYVLLPLLRPALLAALLYSFVRSMTTVSAVIFLVTAENDLATTYIIGRVGNGDYGVALAYCSVLMLLMLVAAWAIQQLVGERQLGRRTPFTTH
jgi:iron(III) transport system permease protein